MASATTVDTGTLGPVTLEQNWFATWGQEASIPPADPQGFTGQAFTVGQWFRMAPSLAPPTADTNLPGTSISVADANAASAGRYGDAVIIDANGNAFPALTVVNTSELTGGAGNLATVFFNWLCASI
jgi:hypothetical protein